MTDTQSPETKRSGTFDMVGLFQAEVEGLKGAVAHGRLLHKTKNIRDSGAPFEAALRKFLRARLPTPFQVMHGYLFDIESHCTPQIDALIVDARERHELMLSTEGAGYVPFTCARAIFEIKNSGEAITKYLTQLANTAKAVGAMTTNLRKKQGSGGGILHQPLTILVIGDSSGVDIDELRAFSQQDKSVMPDYVLFLDRGVIIASKSIFMIMNDSDAYQPINFYEHRTAGAPMICTCDGEFKQGKALLWLYFAIAAFMNFTEGNERVFLSFTNDVMRTYPLHPIKTLYDFSNWSEVDVSSK